MYTPFNSSSFLIGVDMSTKSTPIKPKTTRSEELRQEAIRKKKEGTI
jgi:hypothetical protein